MFTLLRRIRRDTRGATAIEYGLIVALVALAAVGGMTAFADSLNGMWSFVEQNVTTSTTSSTTP